jgi:hypothetical protein
MMIDRTTIRSAAVDAIKLAATAAGNSVYSPLDWPTQPGGYPVIIVRTPNERKENVAPRSGPPQFFSTISLTATARVEALTESSAESQLETLSTQIENAILTNAQFAYDNGVQQFSSVSITMDVRAESERHYGEAVVTFETEVFQLYAPTIDAAGNYIGLPLTATNITINLNTGETLDVGETITVPGG